MEDTYKASKEYGVQTQEGSFVNTSLVLFQTPPSLVHPYHRKYWDADKFDNMRYVGATLAKPGKPLEATYETLLSQSSKWIYLSLGTIVSAAKNAEKRAKMLNVITVLSQLEGYRLIMKIIDKEMELPE